MVRHIGASVRSSLIQAALALLGRLLGWWLGLPARRTAVRISYNLPITMPDGVTLRATRYLAVSQLPGPTIIIRSPYEREWQNGPFALLSMLCAWLFATRGYHVLLQSVRGRFESEGVFEAGLNERADGLATIDWVVRQPWSNQQVGMWGQSYQGYTEWAVATAAPPGLKAIMPGAISSRFYRLFYPNGTFALDSALQILWLLHLDAPEQRGRRALAETLRLCLPSTRRRMARALALTEPAEIAQVIAGRPVEAYDQLLSHPHAADPYWDQRGQNDSFAALTMPVHLISGWYDVMLDGLLDDYAMLRAAQQRPYLTIGPWHHMHLGLVWEGLRSGLMWFDGYLQPDRRHLACPPVRFFVSGVRRWRTTEVWPPATHQLELFLNAQRQLTTALAAPHARPDTYRYDPHDPTPTLGGPLLRVRGAGQQNNRRLEARPDVLCYTSRMLSEAIEIAGVVQLRLYARSSNDYTDFFGRLCDVSPRGHSVNICDGLLRVTPEIGVADAAGIRCYWLEFHPIAHCFRPGHRIRLQISSGAYPRWSRNPGVSQRSNDGTRMAMATQTIYHTTAQRSAVILPTYSPLEG